jgi:hypothetical protein
MEPPCSAYSETVGTGRAQRDAAGEQQAAGGGDFRLYGVGGELLSANEFGDTRGPEQAHWCLRDAADL